MHKGVWVALAVFLFLAASIYGAARYALNQMEAGVVPPPEHEEHAAQMQQYASEDGYTFQYPDTYELSSHASISGDVLVLLPKGYQAPMGGEGPATIAVAVYDAGGKTLEQWVKTDPRSNWQLLVDDRASRPTTVGGKAGLWYHHTGLYETDVVAAEHRGKIILFSVGYNAPTDEVRHDFDHLVESVEFN